MDKQFNYECLEKNLSDYYDKSENSNLSKIFKLIKYIQVGFDKEIDFLKQSLDIQTAAGKTLDLYGEIYGQLRGKMDDNQYRLFILLTIAQNMAGSDHTSIVNALVSALGIPAGAFKLKDGEKSGNVDVEIFPYDVLQTAGITPQQVKDIISSLLATGVSLHNLNVTHKLPETNLYISNAAVFGEYFTIHVEPRLKVELETRLDTNTALICGEFYKLEAVK